MHSDFIPHSTALPPHALTLVARPDLVLGMPSDYLRRAGAVALVIDLLALASLWRSRKHSRKAKLVWTALVALLPVLGAVAWFVLGRERRANRHPAG